MKIRFYFFSFFAFVLSLPSPVNSQQFTFEEADKLVNGAESVVNGKSNQGYLFVRMSDQSNVPANEGLQWLKSTVLKCNPKDELRESKNEKDKFGYTHFRYQQYFSGIPVNEGEYLLHIKNEKVISANGAFFKNINLSVLPAIDSVKALSLSLQHVNSKKLFKDVHPKPELVIVAFTDNYMLAYKTRIYSVDPLKHIDLFLDANSGEVIYEENLITHTDVPGTAKTIYSGIQAITTNQLSPSYFMLSESARNILTLSLHQETDLSDATEIYDSDNYWDDSISHINAAYDLHYGLEKTYDYFLNTFGRNSYNNAGIQVRAYANYGIDYNNAYWDQSNLVFGDGDGSNCTPFTSLEVVGHEFTHAVTSHSARLAGFLEAGALNESFSDIFGTVIDFEVNPSTADYQLGESISVSGLPFRSMSNPNDFGSPDTYLGQFWDYGFFFGGSPHVNNGPSNYCFYLLSEGGSGINDNGDSYFVSPVGRNIAATIAYRALTVYLTRYSNYADARNAYIQSAIDLYGSCSNEVAQVTNAWHAVGVGSKYTNAVIAGFEISQSNFCYLPVTIQFINHSVNASTYAWNFGDGTTSTIPEPVHTYSASGTYVARLIVQGNSLCNLSDTFSITINISPGGPAMAACLPQTVNPCCMTGIYKIDLNDLHNISGSSDEGYRDFTCDMTGHLIAGQNYSIRVFTGKFLNENLKGWIDYNNDGVFDDVNELAFESIDRLRIHVADIYTPLNCVLNTTLRFRIISDISNSDITSPCYQPRNGQVEDYSIVFSSNSLPPVADFSSSNIYVQPGNSLAFFDRSQNVPLSWSWEFQGGSPANSTLQNPVVTYLLPGDYEVKLIVSNTYGTDSIVKISYIHVATHFFMCQVPGTNEFNGELENYPVNLMPPGNINCSFQITLPCSTDIHFDFDHFNMGPNGILKIYDGPGANSPLIFSAVYDTLPAIMPIAHSGTAYIVFSYNYSYLDTSVRFKLNWSSTIVQTHSPFAAFSCSNFSPPVNIPLQFTNQSANSFNYRWDFGDGFVSNVENPVHEFHSPGSFTVKLITETCTSFDSIEHVVNVQPPPGSTIHPHHFDTIVACGNSIILPLTISNAGPGDLHVDLQLPQSIPKKIEVLVLAFGARTQDEIPNALNAASTYSDFNALIYSGSDPAELENLLIDKDVILVPGNYFDKPFKYLSLGPVVRDFVNRGGGIVFLNGSSSYLGNFHSLGLLHPLTYRWSYGQATFPASSHPLVNNVSTSFPLPTYTHALTFKEPDLIKLITFNGFDVLSYRSYGSGKVVFLAFDFYNYEAIDIDLNPEAAQLLSNAFNWASKPERKSIELNSSALSTNHQAGDSNTISITLNGISPGSYSTFIIVNTNQASNPVDTIYVNAIVTGTPLIQLLSTCIHFPSTVELTKRTDTLRFVHTGCGYLEIDSLTSSLPDFNIKSFSALIAEGDTGIAVVEFYPLQTGLLNSTISIHSNIPVTTFCADGNSDDGPALDLSTDSLVFNMMCNTNIASNVTFTNTGGAPLHIITNPPTVIRDSVRILILTASIQTQALTNLVSSINEDCPECNITYVNYFNETYIRQGLEGKDIFIVPPTSLQLANFSGMSPVIKDFVTGGGDVIFWHQSNPTHYFTGSGLIEGYIYGTSNGDAVDFTDPSFPALENIQPGFLTTQWTFVTNILNENKIQLIGLKGNDFTTYLKSGKGYAYFVAHNLWNPDSSIKKIIPGIIETIKDGRLPGWIDFTTDTITVNPGSSLNVPVIFNIQGLPVGQYHGDIVLSSNIPELLYDTIHCRINISGNENISLSESCITFNNVYAGGQSVDTLEIINSGCDTLFLSDIHCHTATFGTYPPYILPSDTFLLGVQFTAGNTGLNSDTIFIHNSDHDTSVCLKITGLNPPILSHQPDSFDIFLNCSDSVSTVLNIANSGQSPLHYSVNRQYDGDTINVAVLTVESYKNYFNSSLNPGFKQEYPKSRFKVLESTNLDSIEKELRNMDVLIVAWYSFNNDSMAFLEYAPLISRFAVNGGTVIFTLQSPLFPTLINATGLFQHSIPNVGNSNSISLINPLHPLADRLPLNILNNGSFMFSSLADVDKVTIAGFSGYDQFAFRYTGNGIAIIVGSTALYSQTSRIMLANSIKWAGSRSHATWVHTVPSGNVLAPSGTSSIAVNINSYGLTAGTYSTNIVLATDDPLRPYDSVPVYLHILGNPSMTLSDTCISFGNVQVNTTAVEYLQIKNTGCDTLFIDSTDVQLNIQALVSKDTLLPGDSTNIMVYFHPVSTGIFNSSMSIYTNDADTAICLRAIVESDPSYSCLQNSIQVTLGCEDSVIVPLTISNLSGGSLHIRNNSLGGASMGSILVITHGVDTVLLLPTLISSIQQYYNTFQVTYFNSTDTAALRIALDECKIVMYPQTSFGNASTIISFRGLLNSFVQEGGSLIVYGSGDNNALYCTSYLGSDFDTDVYGAEVEGVDFTTPLTDNIVFPFIPSGAIFSQVQPNFHTVIEEHDYYGAAVGYEIAGAGRIIYNGFDYTSPNSEESKIAANAVRWSIDSQNRWIILSEDSLDVSAGTSSTINVKIYSAGLSPGIIRDTIILQTNDPLQPFDTIPLVMNVVGQPEITLSDTCLLYNNIPENGQAARTITVTNSGCDTLVVTSFSTSTGFYSVQQSAISLAPGLTTTISVIFSPTSSGNYTDTLVINSNAGTRIACLYGTAIGSPLVIVDPTGFNLMFNCHDTIVEQITVTNTGNAPLSLNAQTYSFIDSTVRILCLVNSTGEYNQFTASLQNYSNFTSQPIYHFNNDSISFAQYLKNTDVIAIYYGYLLTPAISTQLKQFAQRGGTVLLISSGAFESGFFHGYYNNYYPIASVDVINSTHPIAENIPSPFTIGGTGLSAFNFSDSDKEKIIDYAGMDVLTLRKEGKGRVIYYGFQPYLANTINDKLIENMVRWSGELSHQKNVHIDNPGVIINPGDSLQMNLIFTAGNLNTGTHNDTLFIYTNDPAHPVIGLPFQLNITGAPELRLEPPCLNFGQVVSTSHSNSVSVFNDGCSTLFVTGFTHNDSAFTVSAPFSQIDAGSYEQIQVTFNSSFAGLHRDTIYIHTSEGDVAICLEAQPGIPLSNINPDSFYVSLGNCYDSITLPLMIQNTGGTALQTNVINGGSLGQRLEVLALIYGTDTGTEYPNTLAAIRGLSPVFNLTELNSNDSSVLRNSLIGKDVLLIPEPEYGDPNDFTGLGLIMKEFASSGGTVIFCGAAGNQAACIFNTDLFHGSFSGNVGGDLVNVILPADPLAFGVDSMFIALSGAYAVSINDTDKVMVVSHGTYDVATYRNIGSGKVVYLAFDYFNLESNSSSLIANAVEKLARPNHHDWISINPTAMITPSGSTGSLDVTFSTASLNFGIHVDTIFISTNDPFNLMDTIICTLEVTHHFCSDFGYDISCDGLVSFHDFSTNNPTSWQWDFGDGVTSTLQNPVHQYLSPGNYSVVLIASNISETDTIIYSISPHFSQQIMVSDSGAHVPGGQIYFYSNDTVGVNYLWTFGDGSQSILSNPVHSYTSHGVYNVSLTVTDNSGCISITTISVPIIDVFVDDTLIPSSSFIFPNPCKNEATLSYVVEKSAEIEINLYDVLGRKVETLFESIQQSPGNYYLYIQFESMGFYFVSIRMGDQQFVLKVISLN